MAAISYPTALPAPASFPFVLRDRRAASQQPGQQQLRARSRERVIDAKGVRWVYTPAQMEVWRAWFEDTLLDGQRWFSVSLPGRGGWTQRVARYVNGTVRDHKGAGFFEVTADLEISPRLPPQEYASESFSLWRIFGHDYGITTSDYVYETAQDAADAAADAFRAVWGGSETRGDYYLPTPAVEFSPGGRPIKWQMRASNSEGGGPVGYAERLLLT